MGAEVFQELIKMRGEVKQTGVVDAYNILNRLGNVNAFSYCAVVKIDAMLSSLNTPQRYVCVPSLQLTFVFHFFL